MSTARPPVSDFATDWDHTDPQWVQDPFPIWDDLRQRCPIAHTERFHGGWLPTRHDDISAIAYDTEHFSSNRVIVNQVPFSELFLNGHGGAPPITADPPFHGPSRRILLPAFSPKAIDRLEPAARDLCRHLLDGIAGRDRCDAAVDYAQHVPVQVIAHLLGLPASDGDRFRYFIHGVLEDITAPQPDRIRIFEELIAYIDDQIERKRREPADDLLSFLLGAELDGAPLTDEHIRGTAVLLLIAGIDTTWSAIGASLWHLAQHPDDRRRLVAEPDLLPVAVEELLRAYAPVTMARAVKADVELGGCAMRRGDWVLLPFPAANRDPAVFPDADRVVIDRAENRHAAFGLGIHRCLGSNLARLEVRVAIDEWLRRIPEFELAAPDEVVWSAGQVRGPRSLPLRLGG